MLDVNSLPGYDPPAVVCIDTNFLEQLVASIFLRQTSRVISIALVLAQNLVVKKFSYLYVTRMLISVFTKADEKILSGTTERFSPPLEAWKRGKIIILTM